MSGIPPNTLLHIMRVIEAGVELALTSASLSKSLLRAEDKFSTALFPLSTEGEGPTFASFEVLAHLAALHPMTILSMTRIGETLWVGDLVPSSELFSFNSLTTMGSLRTTFGVAGALEEADVLEGTDVLEAAE